MALQILKARKRLWPIVSGLVLGLSFASNMPAWSDARILSGEPIQPLSVPEGLDLRKVELGRRLFSDPILSADGSVSCASCHDLARGGSDHRARSIGIKGAEGTIRAPSVYNSGFNFVQFWDGRAVSLEVQAAGPITNPLEMGSQWPDLLKKLTDNPVYGTAFRLVYGKPPSQAAVTDALATFERTLVTVNSRFDAYLKGDRKAISDEERKGYELFVAYGCASCHQGANVGGNMFERFGFMGNYFADRGTPTQADLGRFNVTGREADRFVFKVPSLRLSALGGPYFHDGSVADLSAAIQIMGRYQLGREIPEKDVDRIMQFLNTLVGKLAQDRT
ncbi:MAG TPA: cytochrome-c peroxidase [Candidatus Sulfotelmatobacter sp.]|nr:cytochrome-c peroxidase [Candidatus Sulfotelmatobacter sp.]